MRRAGQVPLRSGGARIVGKGECALLSYRDQEGRIDVKKPFLVDVPSHEAYHAGHSREPHQTPVHCTHHTEPLYQKLQA